MNLSITLPEELYRRIEALAERQQVSVQRMAAAAIAEQLAGWSRVEERAGRGDRRRYLAALDKVPATEPAPEDRLQ